MERNKPLTPLDPATEELLLALMNQEDPYSRKKLINNFIKKHYHKKNSEEKITYTQNWKEYYQAAILTIRRFW